MTPQLQSALASLNPQQREAVLHVDSPLLILAGAGSGKTRVITVKIAYLIDEIGVDPRSILAVTFTNKAAGEMRHRAAQLVDRSGDVIIRTFHSFGAWFLRRNADLAGIPRGFSIYDDEDSLSLLRSLFPEYNKNTLAAISHQISRAKDYGLRPREDLSPVSEHPDFRSFYQRYDGRLQEIGNVDFGDLILRPVELLESDQDLARRVRSRFRYILVDEYQDSNVAQFRLLRALSNESTSVCVVGDDDQSIYRFRGAEVKNILTFPDSFPNTKIVRLEENYRSTQPILTLAGAVVANNQNRLGKDLFTSKNYGTKPTLALLHDQDDEVSYAIRRIKKARTDNEPGETAILYRTNAQSRVFETALMREEIPYRIVGSLRFYEREEIKDTVAFLKFFANPKDEVSFRRIVNKPSRGIGAKSVNRILDYTGAGGGDLRLAAEYAKSELSKKASKALSEFLDVLDALDRLLAPWDEDSDTSQSIWDLDQVEPPTAGSVPPNSMNQPSDAAPPPDALRLDADAGADQTTLAEFVERVIESSGLAQYHKEQDKAAGTQKLQNLEELVNAAGLYPANQPGLVSFLEAIELDASRERSEESDASVVLITMHNTKGLEFDRVLITGLEDGLFPRNHDPDELEEERRLFYVGVTRAKEELHLTSCRYRRLHGRPITSLPSRFLSEIPEALVTVATDGAGYGPGRGRTTGGAYGNLQEAELPEWPRGTGVYHDSYGQGVVVKSWLSGGEPSVLVRFETGQTAQFLTRFAMLERVAGDGDW